MVKCACIYKLTKAICLEYEKETVLTNSDSNCSLQNFELIHEFVVSTKKHVLFMHFLFYKFIFPFFSFKFLIYLFCFSSLVNVLLKPWCVLNFYIIYICYDILFPQKIYHSIYNLN